MRVDVGGHSLAYQLRGRGREVITLCHGLALQQSTFDELAGRLEEDFQILTFDMRGHGASDTPAGEWTIADLAEDLSRLLERLAIEDTHVFGHSAGGVVGIAFALAHASQLASLVLASAASQANQRAAQGYEEVAQRAEREGGAAVLGTFGMSADQNGRAPDAIGFAKVARCMATLFQAPLTPRLGEIRCPVSIFAGDRDFMGRKSPAILHQNIPGSRLRILENLGHAIYLEDVERVERAIREHLREQ